MKKLLLLTSATLLAVSSISYAGDGHKEDSKKAKKLLKNLCTSCHVLKGKGVVAPPLIAVKRHVKKAYKNKEDFIERIVDWVEEPDAAIALMPGAIKKFGLMPKLPYDKDDVERIAEYMYEADIAQPKWFKKHFEEKHGKDGMPDTHDKEKHDD